MIVLGLDTATAFTTVGVVRDGRLLAEVAERAPGGHASGLPALLERGLVEAGLGLEEVDVLAISVGPGSFTGLRVGLSFAKGIAYAERKRLVAVPTLEALAAAAPERFAFVATCLDARKGEVYLAMFERSAGGSLVRRGDDRAVDPEAAAAAIAGAQGGGDGVLVGDALERYPGAFEGLASRGLTLARFDEVHPQGGQVARLGAERLAAGEAVAPERLLPVYVRASEAELRHRSLTSGKGLS